MKSRNETDFEQLPSDLMLRVNQLCDQYETELRLGELPSIDDYLENVALEYREVILKELIPLEIEHRCQRGETLKSADYLELFPDLEPDWLASVLEAAQADQLAAVVNSSAHKQQNLTAPPSLERCQQRIVKEGILSQAELTALQLASEAEPSSQTSEDLTELLVQSGKITDYQSDVLLSHDDRRLLIADYLILEPIGSGGMGIVYKALHRRMKRIVALKVIRADLQHVPDRLKRFEREVQTAAKLSHSHIVTAYDAGEDQGIHFLICEYIDGESLTQLVRNSGPLDFFDALNCILQVAQGLEYAHRQGVVHRDIKPANILVDDQGDLKILDMGLARLQQPDDVILGAEAQTELTSSQFFMGTIDYMAPEQARNTKFADHRSDIYSLGCTFYFLLTAQPVYQGETTVERILAHRDEPIPRLSERLCQVPPEFDPIFEKMLAKSPDDRYQSATELICDLESFSMECPGDQTALIPQVELSQPQSHKADWASDPTEVQPAVPELTMLASTSQQELAKSGALPVRGLLWGGLAVAAAILIGAFTWKPAVTDHSVADSEVAANLSKTNPSHSMLAPFQQTYAAKMNLPVKREVPLGAGESEIELMLIPPGKFLMGDQTATSAESDAPQHQVSLTRPYYMSATEITNEQFREFVNATKYQTDAERSGGYGMTGGSWVKTMDYSWKNLGDLPVQNQAPAVSISWNDATAFCEWLSDKTGDRYRLPTEAEWEYACRAGTDSAWFFGDQPSEMDQYAWFLNNSDGQVYPVKQKRPNAFGLYDVYGNEWEWCQDYYSASYYSVSPVENPTGPAQGRERVRRGGGFQQPAAQLTSYIRGHGLPETPSRGAFRIVRETQLD
ncbi:bifunctional serine/threonine-protein kinase/formylglycine-generating enzyme family protein [Gimesia algae]|uniref:non-specific serine/threonine protein kinase n=1 Tax=Gimesia algae TaxID=2527971 RepID=A0A517VG56_9PLAN|nr:bifunctional serine/threonine-protein kinase/formylglycine-generating enzyme family protein [Gimesia algae]QDT91989.1 Serine/threonine-protein kinase PknB [Gimesia algae]